MNLNKVLENAEFILPELLMNNSLHTMNIDYEYPNVHRVWFQHGDYRIFLHKIFKPEADKPVLYHPHPWSSVIKIYDGIYEMGVGHSATIDVPETDCILHLCPGTIYEMTNPNGWHYVRPISDAVLSLMVTCNPNKREMPIRPGNPPKPLSKEEAYWLIHNILKYNKYVIDLDEIIKNIKL